MESFCRYIACALVTYMVMILSSTLSRAADPVPRPGAPATTERGRFTVNRPVGEATTPVQRRDQQIADWLVACNQNETALAHFAASKTENKQVRDFAEKLQHDHSQGLPKLERFASRMPAAAPAAAATPGARQGGVEVVAPFVDVNVGGTAQPGTNDQMGLNYAAVMRQIGQQCLNSTEKEWEQKNAHERDMAFVGTQIAMHQHLIATEEVLRQYASPDLQAVIDEGLKVARAHQHDAVRLIEELAHHEQSSK
ncbi:MAG TPA: DUF4142 domain-containing protein [Pirellulales bacterium]|nr:DUF4142 domain-containing protein [Pirellulales bacterium]